VTPPQGRERVDRRGLAATVGSRLGAARYAAFERPTLTGVCAFLDDGGGCLTLGLGKHACRTAWRRPPVGRWDNAVRRVARELVRADVPCACAAPPRGKELASSPWLKLLAAHETVFSGHGAAGAARVARRVAPLRRARGVEGGLVEGEGKVAAPRGGDQEGGRGCERGRARLQRRRLSVVCDALAIALIVCSRPPRGRSDTWLRRWRGSQRTDRSCPRRTR
jgi:hypothetical protein